MKGSVQVVPSYFKKVPGDTEGKATFDWKPKGKLIKVSFEGLELIAKDNQITAENLNTRVMPALNIIPFRCYRSPMVAMLSFKEDQRFYVSTTSLQNIWDLLLMKMYYVTKMYMYEHEKNTKKARALAEVINNKEVILKCHDEFEKDITKFFNTMKDNGITSPKSLKATVCMKEFVEMMRLHTFKYMHMLERIVWHCACIDSESDGIEPFTTPTIPVHPDIPYPTKRYAEDVLAFAQWFKNKQFFFYAQDTRAKQPMVKHISHEIIKGYMEEYANDEKRVHDKMTPYQTLWEYAMLLDDRGEISILKEASKGRQISASDKNEFEQRKK